MYGVPETFVVDPKGVIRFKHTGPLSAGDIDKELVPAIARAKASRRLTPADQERRFASVRQDGR